MVAGQIAAKVRLLLSEPSTTRFSDADILGFINDAQRQLAYEVDFPEDIYQIITVPNKREYQMIDCIKILRVYMIVGYNPMTGTYTSKQELIPTDMPTLAGKNYDLFDQSSGQVLGNPTFTPSWEAQQPESYPVVGGGLGTFPQPVQQPWNQPAAPGAQRPKYYMRGGFIGIMPPPVAQYYIQIECIPSPPDMDSSLSICTFPDGCKDAISYKACEYATLSDKTSQTDDFAKRFMLELPKLRWWRDRLQGSKSRALIPITKRTFMRAGWDTCGGSGGWGY